MFFCPAWGIQDKRDNKENPKAHRVLTKKHLDMEFCGGKKI